MTKFMCVSDGLSDTPPMQTELKLSNQQKELALLIAAL